MTRSVMEETAAKIDQNETETNWVEEEEYQHVQNGVTIMPSQWTNCRNLSGFWLLGLCNNYAYVIMLSAAFDILSKDYHDADHNETENNITRRCNPTSTGAILLADIIPSLAIKLIVPFFVTNTHLKVALSVLLSAASFLLTSLSVGSWMTYIGVICAALSGGLGEVSFLSFSAHFDK
ncbi:battenin-like isoform X2 [Limulus polyphemus]|uniref:Battenin n=1 Tax=Limulus polyphemus TaxID=6850 RepID=A0ABM1RWA1_LIMPO|nr:battenin-like isoform X2 [Limulus polyphemus]